MWIRTAGINNDKLVNLDRVDYLSIEQWPPRTGPWCLVGVYVVESGNVLSVNDTHVIIRQGADSGGLAQGLMLDAMRDIENQLMDGAVYFREPVTE